CPPCYSLFPYTTLFRSTFTYDREAPSVNADLDSLQAIVTINGNPVDLLENLFLPTKLSYEVFVERSVGQVLLNASSSHNATISRSEEHTSELQSRENLV